MRRRAVLFGALAALGLGGSAAPEPWMVLREASTIEMSVRAFGGSHRGRFDDWRGDIAFDPAAPSRTSATVVVQSGSLKMRPAAVTGRAVGPAFLWPVGTDGLSSGKWAAGPSALVLRQQSGTTIGFLANHLWSYAGDSDRNDISATFLQPFLSHTWPSTTGVTLNMEASYDWHAEEWTVPVNLGVSHIYSFGTQKVQMGIFGRAYLDAPEGGPDWGVRFVMTLLIPD